MKEEISIKLYKTKNHTHLNDCLLCIFGDGYCDKNEKRCKDGYYYDRIGNNNFINGIKN